MADRKAHRQGATRRGKPHCEAFPALDILGAIRGLKAGADHCVWQNEQEQIIGHGYVASLTADSASVGYQFYGSANVPRAEGVLTVRVRQTRRNPHVLRSGFVCPTCDRSAEKLFFVMSEWQCRVCHSLVFFSQRLGQANKKISARDDITSRIEAKQTNNHCGRAYHNQVRHLKRINRNLEAQGLLALPQELLFRTDQIWRTPTEMRARLAAVETAGATGGSSEAAASDGLAFFKAKASPSKPIMRGELVGSSLFRRPCASYFTDQQHEEAHRLIADIREGRLGQQTIREAEFVALLVERSKIEPLALLTAWEPIQRSTNETGVDEFAISAAFTGDPRLWRLCAGDKPDERVLKAILDERRIELRVRLCGAGPFDPRADLEDAARRLARQLARLNNKIDAHNLQRPGKARGWASRHLASRLTQFHRTQR